MAIKRTGLGRNLSALLSATATHRPLTPPTEHGLPLDKLQPGKYQPRTIMNDESLQELAASIKHQGVLQPIVVRKLEHERYEILAGERRWRAARLAGLTQVPVLVREVDDETAMAIGLVENLQGEELNALDQAHAMARLVDEFNLTHQQIAELLGKSRATISNHLRLISLVPFVKQLIEHGDLDMGHARALLGLAQDRQAQTAELVLAKNLSVRETEQLVERLKKPSVSPKTKTPTPTPDYIHDLAHFLQTKIEFKQNKAGKGFITIHYDSPDNLDSVIQQILKQPHKAPA